MSKRHDDIYAAPLSELVDVSFDERVADVFPDMSQCSGPGYGMLITTIGLLVALWGEAQSPAGLRG